MCSTHQMGRNISLQLNLEGRFEMNWLCMEVGFFLLQNLKFWFFFQVHSWLNFLVSGRMNLADLSQILRVDYPVVESKVQDLVSHDNSLYLVLGQLLNSDYLDRLTEEINDKLQQDGCISLSELTKSYDIPPDFLLKVFYMNLSSIIWLSGILICKVYCGSNWRSVWVAFFKDNKIQLIQNCSLLRHMSPAIEAGSEGYCQLSHVLCHVLISSHMVAFLNTSFIVSQSFYPENFSSTHIFLWRLANNLADKSTWPAGRYTEMKLTLS